MDKRVENEIEGWGKRGSSQQWQFAAEVRVFHAVDSLEIYPPYNHTVFKVIHNLSRMSFFLFKYNITYSG